MTQTQTAPSVRTERTARPGVVVFNDTRVDQHHGCARVMSVIEQQLHRIGRDILALVPAHHDWRDDPGVLEALDGASLVIVNGEGTLHHSRPAAHLLMDAGAAAKARGIPAALINALWQDNDLILTDKLRHFDIVSARDSWSAREIQAAGVSCRVVPDLSLYQVRSRAEAREGIGFTDSVNRLESVRLERLRRRMHGKAIVIRSAPRGVRSGWRFLRSYVAASDLAAPSLAAATLRVALTQYANRQSSVDDYVRSIASLELLVSGRFHACTLALATATPLIAAATNSHKLSALINDAGLAGWRGSVDLSVSSVEDARRRGWEEQERMAIREYLEESRAGTERLFDDIRSLA